MRPRIGLLAPLILCGCAPKPTRVWVDLNSISLSLPHLPAPARLAQNTGSPAVTFGLAGRQAEIVTGPTEAKDAETTAAAERSQAAALKRLRQRLAAVYSRQADFYAEEQTRLVGDIGSRALDKYLPELRRLFGSYATQRTPLVINLASLAGFPDVNPKGGPPVVGLTPLAQKLWLQANGVRNQIVALDAGYSRDATAVLTQADHLADHERLALLTKIEEYRRQMNEKAMSEAANPFESAAGAQALHLSSEPAVVLPPLPLRTMTLPAVAPLPSPPKVDLGEAQPSISQQRMLLGRQLSIWLALNQRELARGPGRGIPDETGDFDHWRQQQEAGP